MAGWDGDALAGSLEEALERQQEAAEARRLLRSNTISTEERERTARVESLKLSQARIASQLEQASNPAHRTMLERALAALEAQIATACSDVAAGTNKVES